MCVSLSPDISLRGLRTDGPPLPLVPVELAGLPCSRQKMVIGWEGGVPPRLPGGKDSAMFGVAAPRPEEPYQCDRPRRLCRQRRDGGVGAPGRRL